MKTKNTRTFPDEKILARFIREILLSPDTPSLIRLVANNANYLILSSHIVNATRQDNRAFFERLLKACKTQHIEFRQLQEKLGPVTRCLGLTEPHTDQIDYYEILGVTPEADTVKIRRAFREKAYEVHPDTGRLGQAGSRAFVELHTAYQTLNDPNLRKQYDQSRQELGAWIETPAANQSRRSANRYYYQIGGLLFSLIIATFIFDFLYRENALTNGHKSGSAPTPPATKASTLSPRSKDINSENRIAENPSGNLISAEAGLESVLDKLELNKYVVYLYYAKESDVEVMEKLAGFLKQKGYVTLKIQKQAHQHRDIRYFFDEDKAPALVLQSDVYEFFSEIFYIQNKPLQVRNLCGAFPETERGSLELWIDRLDLNSS